MTRASAAALAIWLTAACGSGRPPVTAPTVVEPAASLQAITVDVGAGTVRLRVGEELVVRRPDTDRRWEVTGNGVLELIGVPDATRDGWRFRARRTGRAQLTFTGHSRQTCATPADCPPPPAPPELTLLVEVQD